MARDILPGRGEVFVFNRHTVQQARTGAQRLRLFLKLPHQK